MRIADKLWRNTRIRIGIPGISYEITPDELINHESVDERIQKLGKVKNDLFDAIEAVKSLEVEAHKNKDELEQLDAQLEKLREDKKTTEHLLKVPEQSFARVLGKASKGGQWQGLIVGFIFGILASLIANWIWLYIAP